MKIVYLISLLAIFEFVLASDEQIDWRSGLGLWETFERIAPETVKLHMIEIKPEEIYVEVYLSPYYSDQILPLNTFMRAVRDEIGVSMKLVKYSEGNRNVYYEKSSPFGLTFTIPPDNRK